MRRTLMTYAAVTVVSICIGGSNAFARGFYVPRATAGMYPPPVMVPGRLPNLYSNGYYGLGFAAQGFQVVPWPNQGPSGIWQQWWMWPVRPWVAH